MNIKIYYRNLDLYQEKKLCDDAINYIKGIFEESKYNDGMSILILDKENKNIMKYISYLVKDHRNFLKRCIIERKNEDSLFRE